MLIRSAAALLLASGTSTLPAQHSWRRVFPNTTPWALSDIAYDPDRKVVVLAGRDVQTGNGPNHHYEWDGTDWRDLGLSPVPGGGKMCYDQRRKRMLKVAGRTTWEFDGKAWAIIATDTSVSGLAALAWDGNLGQVIRFGGSPVQMTQAWDGKTWTTLTTGGPSVRDGHEMVWDSLHRKVILFGGRNGERDTWEWDGRTWRQRFPKTSPPANYYMDLAYHKEIGRVIAFGGQNWGSDNWHWDGDDWHRYGSLGAPTSTTGGFGNLAYMDDRKQIVMIGTTTNRTPIPVITYVYNAQLKTPAQTSAFGSGCPGSSGTPILQFTEPPYLGYPMQLDLQNLPSGLVNMAFVFLGTSDQNWSGTPLPLNLAPLGAPACSLLVRPDLLVPMVKQGGTATLGVDLPKQVSLLGLKAHAQGFVADATANALGAAVSNGVTCVVGQRF